MALVQRLVEAESDYLLSLVCPIQAMYGEAGGIATAHFGEAVALAMPASTDPSFNRVLGFGDEELPLLDDILNWYACRDAVCRFDILSGAFSSLLVDGLEEHGFVSRPLETFLSVAPTLHALPKKQDMEIRELAPHDLSDFSSAFLAVYPQSPAVEEAVRTCLQAQYSQPEWRCYLACIVGTVAAFGAMYIHNGMAALISAATLPQFRRRGCQMALLTRRLADAAELGCDLAWSHAVCGSTSQRNMERQGMCPVSIKYRFERPIASS